MVHFSRPPIGAHGSRMRRPCLRPFGHLRFHGAGGHREVRQGSHVGWVSFQDEVVGAASEAVERRIGLDGVVGEGEPAGVLSEVIR